MGKGMSYLSHERWFHMNLQERITVGNNAQQNRPAKKKKKKKKKKDWAQSKQMDDDCNLMNFPL